MSRSIMVDGARCVVVEALGYNPDIGGRVTVVLHEGAQRKAVRVGAGPWRFWTPADRVKPLADALRRGGG